MSESGHKPRRRSGPGTSLCPQCLRSRRNFVHRSERRQGRVEDGRGSLSHAATLRFPSPLIGRRRGKRHDHAALLAWAAPEQVCAALERAAVKRIAELDAQLLELEQREEALIERAHGDGIDILRRPDAAPAAVLGVVIAQAQVA
jgi:hypothetical protein